MNSNKLSSVPGHNSVPGNYIFFAAMMAGYSILGSALEVVTYSFEVCTSFKEIYITFQLPWGCILG